MFLLNKDYCLLMFLSSLSLKNTDKTQSPTARQVSVSPKYLIWMS